MIETQMKALKEQYQMLLETTSGSQHIPYLNWMIWLDKANLLQQTSLKSTWNARFILRIK